jgi:mannose-6-phosphate isomerase-like protein (cupin superfamily)|tara:strand:+ start:4131 stop:4679 length:549 start_codon:yes stop_codon:yes gene_type:complete
LEVPLKTSYLVLRADDIEPFTHPKEKYYHSQHVIGNENTGGHDLLINRGTLDAHRELAGGNHPDNDEIYYVVKGSSLVDLGGHRDTGDGCQTYELEEGMVVFIPAGTYHRLRNVTDEEFIILAIWPQEAARGANGIHDLRVDTWGTGFRLRQGREMETDGLASRVVERATDWDPLQAVRSDS